MNANQTSAKGAEVAAKAAVLGNGKEVANKETMTTENAPLILLPTLPSEPKADKKPSGKTEKPKAEKQPRTETEAAVLSKPKKMSIDELTDKAERVYLLQNKYASIRDKRKQLQSFTLKHEEETAQLTLVDAKGMSIVTHNPTAIGNLLADWMKDLNKKLKEVEENLRAEFEQLS